ncbi:hypothetical protein DFH28DRAFT_1129009 [Melampsora americana]|nr:hypothetical protein DFH28DRAFT_1129009 [Melampsora americana]
MSHNVFIHATVPITSTSLKITDGYLAYYQSSGHLVINGSESNICMVPITALGFITQSRTLAMSHLYNLSGPFSHNLDTETVTIEHTFNSQFDIGEYEGPYSNLAGQATITGIGVIVSVSFCDPDCSLLPWNMILTVQHDSVDPLTHRNVAFAIDYHFEQLTPASYEWPLYKTGVEVWLHGKLDHKNQQSGRFVVLIDHFRIINAHV